MSQTIARRREDPLAIADDARSDTAAQDTAAALRLAERLAEEMGERWSRGERPTCEDYLASHPLLAQHCEAVMELVYEEICQR